MTRTSQLYSSIVAKEQAATPITSLYLRPYNAAGEHQWSTAEDLKPIAAFAEVLPEVRACCSAPS